MEQDLQKQKALLDNLGSMWEGMNKSSTMISSMQGNEQSKLSTNLSHKQPSILEQL